MHVYVVEAGSDSHTLQIDYLRRRGISALLPTAEKRPLVTAKASAYGFPVSTVMTVPLI